MLGNDVIWESDWKGERISVYFNRKAFTFRYIYVYTDENGGNANILNELFALIIRLYES